MPVMFNDVLQRPVVGPSCVLEPFLQVLMLPGSRRQLHHLGPIDGLWSLRVQCGLYGGFIYFVQIIVEFRPLSLFAFCETICIFFCR